MSGVHIDTLSSKPVKPKRLQYKNASKRELVFSDSSFLVYEKLPVDHMRLFNKDLVVHDNKLIYKSFILGSIDSNRLITWVSEELFKFPVIE